MSNLTLRLQTLYTLVSSKLWYHLLTIDLFRSKLSHEFIHYITYLKNSNNLKVSDTIHQNKID